jgi:hypothetical protein
MDATFPARVQFTELERECIGHRLGTFCIAEALSDRDELTDAQVAAECARLELIEEDMAARLAASVDFEIRNEDEAAILADAFEGSTWWANVFDELEPAQRGAAMRLHDRIRAKLAAAIGRDLVSPLG